MEFFKPNRNYFLESFCSDSKNEDTFRVIKAFLRKQRLEFNPIYIYGEAGTGKTHLMQAITHQMLASHKNVHYTTGRGFGKDLRKAIMDNDILGMRQLYRNVDILIVEDIYYLGGKPKIQEEMTHTLISRYENKKMTFFSSRKHPNRLKKFDEWLSTRLGMGLTLEVV